MDVVSPLMFLVEKNIMSSLWFNQLVSQIIIQGANPSISI